MGILRTVGDLVWAGLGTLLVLAVVVIGFRIVRAKVPGTGGVVSKVAQATGVNI